MTYASTAALSQDTDFTMRVTACYTTESPQTEFPQTWAENKRWAIAAQPGFGDAYASALASNVTRPGLDESVITDAQILGAVQLLITAEAGI
jgi:hypothetical protein